MKTIWFLTLLFLSIGGFSSGYCRNVSSRPAVVRIGALFAFNSTIGRAAKFAIKEAVKDVNSNSSILQGTELTVTMQNSNCNGFIGMVEALQFMETDIVAIIGPQCSTVAHLISIIANELKVPLLSFAATDPTLTSLDMPFFVRTTQNDLYQMDAIAEIVDYYGWKSVIAIYVDDDYGRNGVSALSDKLAQRRCRISYKLGITPGSGVTRGDIMDLLVKVDLMESRIIILHVGPDMGLMFFSVAYYLGMMDNGYVWIATDWLANILDSNPFLPHETMDTLQGVLALRQYSPDSDKKIAFLSRWRDLSSSSFDMSSYGFNAYDSVWILAHAIDAFFYQGGIISFSNDSKLQAMDGGNLRLDAMTLFDDGKLLLDKILETDIIGLSGHLKFTPERSLIHPAYDIINVIGTGYHRIGYWFDHSGLSTVPPETLYTRPLDRSNGSLWRYSVIWPGETVSKPRGWIFSNHGKLLKIGVPRRVSFKEFVTQVNQTNTFEGFCIDVFKAAVDLLPYPLPYEFIPFGDGRHNPSYTELVKLISTGVIDAAVGDIAIVTNRTKMVDFTQPYAASRLVVVAPFEKMNNRALSFLQPFSPRMWIVTAFFSLFFGIVVWTLEHRINNEFQGPPRKQVTTVLFFSFSSIIVTPRKKIISVLGRTVMIVSLFVVFIINKTYSANLASILTVQKLSSHVKGTQSLIKSDEPIGYQTGSFAEYYLSQKLNISKSRLVSLNSPEEYAAALTNGPDKGGVMAVVDELPYIELFLSNHCSFRISGEDFTKISWGFAFPRDSPLAIDLSTTILKLTENGYLERTHDKWLTKDTCDTENTELESYQLHLRSFRGLFLICGIACVVALFIYITCTARKLQLSWPPAIHF